MNSISAIGSATHPRLAPTTFHRVVRAAGLAGLLALASAPSLTAQPPPGLPRPRSVGGAGAGATPAAPEPAAEPEPAIFSVVPAAPGSVPLGPARSHPALRPEEPIDPNMMLEVKLPMTDLSTVLEFYASLCKRVLITRPTDVEGVRLSLIAPEPLPAITALEALDAVMAHNGFSLQPVGDRFLKLIKTEEILSETTIRMREPQLEPRENLVSQLVQLKNVDAAQVQVDIGTLLHTYGDAQVLQGSNALLITETEANIKRLLEIIDFLDQPGWKAVEWRIYELENAQASEVASRLQELITVEAAATGPARPGSLRTGTGATPAASAIRNPNLRRVVAPTQPGQPAAAMAVETMASPFARGMTEDAVVEGQVKLVADDRTNLLILITRPVNFEFFDEMIAILDKEVMPDVDIKIVPLYFADAVDLATILGTLVGQPTSVISQSTRSGRQATGMGGLTSGIGMGTGMGSRLGSSRYGSMGSSSRYSGGSRYGSSYGTPYGYYGAQQAATLPAPGGGTAARPGSATGQESLAASLLEEEVQILADERTNSLIVMATKEDFELLDRVIADLDIQLAQVMIEVVIGEVTLTDSTDLGVNWIQKSLTAYNERNVAGVDIFEPVFSFAGGKDGRDTMDASTVTDAASYPDVAGLTYLFSSNDFNVDALLTALATSTDFKVLSRPLIVTSHNQPGNIIVGTSRPIVTSTYTSLTGSDVQSSQWEYRDIGIELEILPKINAGEVVVLEIRQVVDNIAGETLIDNNQVPIISRREASAFVTIKNDHTVVLGGLMEETESISNSGVPILKDIPILGFFFRTKGTEKNRTELLVFITPHVMANEKEVAELTKYTAEDAQGLQEMDAFKREKHRLKTEFDTRDAERAAGPASGAAARPAAPTGEEPIFQAVPGTAGAETGREPPAGVVYFPKEEASETDAGRWKIVVGGPSAGEGAPGSILQRLKGESETIAEPETDPEMTLEEARQLVIAGEIELAIASLEQAVAQRPDHFGLRRALAQVLLVRGDADAAVRELKAMLELNPYHADGWYQLGKTYLDLGDAAQAQQAFGAFLEVSPPTDPRRAEIEALIQPAAPGAEPAPRSEEAGPAAAPPDITRPAPDAVPGPEPETKIEPPAEAPAATPPAPAAEDPS